MVEWFQERYISREEHQEIVEYYRKLVATLQHTVGELRTQVDAENIDAMVELSRRGRERERRKSKQGEHRDNVINVDFRRLR